MVTLPFSNVQFLDAKIACVYIFKKSMTNKLVFFVFRTWSVLNSKFSEGKLILI